MRNFCCQQLTLEEPNVRHRDFSRRRRGGAPAGDPATPRSLAVKVRKVDNTVAFRAKIDGFHIEKRQLEPFLKLNSVQLERKQSGSIRPPSPVSRFLKFCAFHPNALVLLRRRETSPRSLRHEGVGSPRQSAFTVKRTNFESGTLDCFVAIARRKTASTNTLWLLAMTTTVQPNGVTPQASTLSALYDRQRSTPSPDSASAIAIAAMRS